MADKSSAAVDRLTASITKNQDVTASLLEVVSTIATQIRAAGDNTASLNALADKLDAENANIATAVLACASSAAVLTASR